MEQQNRRYGRNFERSLQMYVEKDKYHKMTGGVVL